MESLGEPECFLIREEPIRRLPRLVFAVSEACRRNGDAPINMAALPNAIGAKCGLCGFALSGQELLALANISNANEKSTMLKRLRDGHCAREGCTSSHYSLLFYDQPNLNWAAVLGETRATEEAKPEHERAKISVPRPRIVVPKQARVGAAIAMGCLLVWFWWQWNSGGRIPFLREPEHFRVAPGPDPARH